MTPVQAIGFNCLGEQMQGILHSGAPDASTGVLVVVGGPQYRVGSHRQFVLLSRALSDQGVPVLRFDYRGLGDSTGEARTFEDIGTDIRAAIDEFLRSVPSLKRVVIWGLCDAASAALFYAPGDARVGGLVLLNPWVRSQQTIAKAYLRSYYVRRLFDLGAWRDLVTGGRLAAAVRSFAGLVKQSRGPSDATKSAQAGKEPAAESELVLRMRRGFSSFTGPVLVILSGDDITAAEFRTATDNKTWRRLLEQQRVSRCDLDAADHTFSSRAWRDQVAGWTAQWLARQWPAPTQHTMDRQ